MHIKKLLLLSSGGDSPGMNAALRAVLRTAIYHGIEVYGCKRGYQGLIERDVIRLHSEAAANTLQQGGTFLQTGRCADFLLTEVRAQCKQFLTELAIDGMIVLGGDGSFRGAALLEQEGGPKTIGIPCTIDNDIIGTDYTIGFDTACNTALQAIDKIRDTAFSFNRHFIVEVMGRAAGFLAVEVGIAAGAEFILIPEKPLTAHEIVEKIQQRGRKKLASIIVAAEADNAGHCFQLSEQIRLLSGLHYKVCVLGHIQRGGAPTVKDRRMASLMGYHAVNLLLEGASKKMIAFTHNQLLAADFPDPHQGARLFSDFQLLSLNNIICNT